MKSIEPDTLLAALRWRYATQQFDPARKIDPATWQALEKSLVLSASSFGLQPWKFIIVTNPDVRELLLSLSWGQKQVVDSSHFVVFAVKYPLTAEDVRKHAERTAEVHGVPVEQFARFESTVNKVLAQPFDQRAWSTRQVYLALGNFLTSAALLGVDVCPMEGLQPEAYDQALGLEGTGYYTVVACSVGHRVETDKYAQLPKVRFAATDVVTYLA